jgi:hypothetical protein
VVTSAAVSKDAREEIESAARAQRAAHAPETVHKKERTVHRTVLEESLTGASKGNPVILALGIPLVMVVMFVFFVILPLVFKSGWPVLVGIPVMIGSMYGIGYGLTRWQAAVRAGAVRRIGHGFDANAYLEALSQKRRSGRLTTTVRFNDAWDAELKRSTADAIGKWAPGVKEPRWDGDRVLHLDTDSARLVETYRKGRYARVTVFTNYPLHSVMRTITKHVLPRLHAVHPIASFEAKITGNVCPVLEEP